MSDLPVHETVRRSKSNDRFSSLSYPSDLGPSFMNIGFIDYSYDAARSGKNPEGALKSSISLPLPENINDKFAIDVDKADLGTGGDLMVTSFNDTPGGLLAKTAEIGQASGEAAKEILGTMFSGNFEGSADIGQAAKFFARDKIEGLLPGLSLALDVASGTAVNPHVTLNFDGVNLKQFTFTWRLAPKNTIDVGAIQAISTHIKKEILPAYQSVINGDSTFSRGLLKYPKLAIISMYGIQQSHYVAFFKPGMVQDFSIDYTPNGHATLAGGYPAFINMSLTFKEAQIHTTEDYGGSSGGEVDATRYGSIGDSSSMYLKS